MKARVEDNISRDIKTAVRKRVEVMAFGISYVGRLEKVDFKEGNIRIKDEKDHVVLEIERIEAFRVLHS